MDIRHYTNAIWMVCLRKNTYKYTKCNWHQSQTWKWVWMSTLIDHILFDNGSYVTVIHIKLSLENDRVQTLTKMVKFGWLLSFWSHKSFGYFVIILFHFMRLIVSGNGTLTFKNVWWNYFYRRFTSITINIFPTVWMTQRTDSNECTNYIFDLLVCFDIFEFCSDYLTQYTYELYYYVLV